MKISSNKYSNKCITVDNIKFQSKLEAKRYKQLTLLEKAKEIKNLRLQVPFLLQESFRKNNKTYRKIEYIADFVYEQNGQTIVEDTKGVKTDVFKIKQKLFEYKYPDLTLKIITKKEIQKRKRGKAMSYKAENIDTDKFLNQIEFF